MQPQTQPPEPSNDTAIVACLTELETLLKVDSPDRDFQCFWSKNWAPPGRPDDPEYGGGPWGSPVNLAEAFGTSADDDWAYAQGHWAGAETSKSDSSDTGERDDQSPDEPSTGGQDVPPNRR
jgi:hypothetical protein